MPSIVVFVLRIVTPWYKPLIVIVIYSRVIHKFTTNPVCLGLFGLLVPSPFDSYAGGFVSHVTEFDLRVLIHQFHVFDNLTNQSIGRLERITPDHLPSQ